MKTIDKSYEFNRIRACAERLKLRQSELVFNTLMYHLKKLEDSMKTKEEIA